MEAVLKRFGPYLLFAALATALLPEVVFRGQVFLGGLDRTTDELPALQFAAAALRSGHWPIWNSRALAGFVALGSSNLRLLYPFNLLIILLFPHHVAAATSWRMVVELFIQLFLYYALFLKVWKDRLLATFSALAAALSIYTTTCCGVGGGNAFLGAILWVLWDWPERTMRLNVVLLTLALFFDLTSGHYQLTAYGALFCLAFSAARCGRRPYDLQKLAALWLTAGALTFALDSIELIPFLQTQALSSRQAVAYDQMPGGPWIVALRLLLPGYPGGFCQHAFPAYAGIATLFFCLVAARKPIAFDTLPWLASIVLLSAVSLQGRLQGILHAAFLSRPIPHLRIATLIPLCMAFLAPVGLRRLLSASARERWAWVALAAGLAAGLFLVVGGRLGPRWALSSWLPPDDRMSIYCQIPRHLSGTLPERLRDEADVLLAFFGALAAILALHARRILSEQRVKLSCVALLAADLVFSGRHYGMHRNFSGSGEPQTAGKVWDFLRRRPDKDRYRFDLDVEPFNQNAGLVNDLNAVGGNEPVINRRYWDLVQVGLPPPSSPRERMFRYRNVLAPVRDRATADLFAVKYLALTPDERARCEPFSRLALRTPEALVCEALKPVPLFHLACRVEETPPSAADFLGAVRSQHADLRDVVFLEPSDKGIPGEWRQCHRASSDRLEMSEAGPGWFRGKAHLSQPAILVAAETSMPGWRASVNGNPAAIHRANYAFQAVVLPSGDSSIEMRFRFPHFTGAVAATAGSLCALMLMALWSIIAGKKRESDLRSRIASPS